MSGKTTPRPSLDEWIKTVKNPDTVRYIQDRIIDQMDFYRIKGRECKKKYQSLMLCSIVISSMIPVASILADGSIAIKVVIALLGSASTAIGAYLHLHKYNELWSSYRCNREFLLSTLYSYFMGTGIFRNLSNQDEADKLLVDTCEACFQSENKSWLTLVKEKEKMN